MITSPDGHGIILLGCYESMDKIYELRNIDGDLQWNILPQKLKHPRTNTVTMLIPDDLTNCY